MAFYDDHEEKRQGRVIVDEIEARDGAVRVYWSPRRGRVVISVYAVTAEEKQNQVVEWIEGLKAKGDFNLTVTVDFYERENWIETPTGKDAWVGHRGPETRIRTIEL